MSKSLSDLAAERLRMVLAAERVKASELAQRMQTNDTWVWRRVHGEVSLTMTDIERISVALGVPVARLLPDLREQVAA